jgi:hypothetical protein
MAGGDILCFWLPDKTACRQAPPSVGGRTGRNSGKDCVPTICNKSVQLRNKMLANSNQNIL